MLPPELEQLRDAINACERDADALVSDLDDEGVNWRPPPGVGWSIAQCLNHLTQMNEFYLRGCLARVREAKAAGVTPFAGLRPTPIGRWFAAWMEPPVRLKFKANAEVMPSPRLPRAGLVSAYVISHQEYRNLLEAAAEVDVNRVIQPNPFYPQIRMRLSTMMLLIPAHDRRHLWQARNIKTQLASHRALGR